MRVIIGVIRVIRASPVTFREKRRHTISSE